MCKNKPEKVLNNPWNKAFWYVTALVDSDQFGGIGKNPETMLNLSVVLKQTVELMKDESIRKVLDALRTALRITLIDGETDAEKRRKTEQLCEFLETKLLRPIDFHVFALTCGKLMLPFSKSLKIAPMDEEIYAESIASGILKAKGKRGLTTIINIWDDLGKQCRLWGERVEAVRIFGNLGQYLAARMNEEEIDIILSAFAQEFERRIGQKRPGRAGRSVESVADFILDYFNISSSEGPEHFTAALEIDRWVKTSDGWLIGISCKRTLRERWKQVTTSDLGLLDRNKIKEIWHLVTYTSDLTDDKITEMGSHRAKIYLPDDDPVLKRATKHPGLKNYVRGMTNFVEDLQEEVT